MQPQLHRANSIQNSLEQSSENWFEYRIRAQPHHTDYAGVVWHGNYVAWMEEARVECLRSLGIDYTNLVDLGCELRVVELSVRYHRPVRLGVTAVVKVRLSKGTGVRLPCDYQIQSEDGQELFVTAQVILVAVDRDKEKIMRQLPSTVKEALAKFSA
jgi:acyl-CoA thioester hydrolase